MSLAHIACGLEVKFTGGAKADGVFEGYGAVFNNLDSYGDVIAPGAFAATLASARSRNWMPKMLLQHGGGIFSMAEDGIPVGKWTAMAEDTKGLTVEGELFALNTQKGQYIYEGMKSGALDGLSIGFVAVGIKYGQTATEPERTLTEIDLFECSIVTFPANDEATITSVKSALFGKLEQLNTLSEYEGFLRDAGFSRTQARTFVSRLKKCLIQSDSERQSEILRGANTLVAGLLSNITLRK